MEWQVRSISRRCEVSGEQFRVGDKVTCIIYKPEGVDVARADVLAANLERFHVNGIELGRWSREIKDRMEEEREARMQLLASREEFFLSLYADAGDPSGDKAVLKQFLALLLERKRVLRAQGRPAGGVQRYLHVRTQEMYDVPADEFQPEQIARIQTVLETLLG